VKEQIKKIKIKNLRKYALLCPLNAEAMKMLTTKNGD
jgi:hypothetical protein